MLCDCLGEYCRLIGNDDLALFYGGKVEIVITDRIIGYDLQFFSSCVEYLRVNLVSQKRQDGRCTLDESCKLAGLESSRVLADFDRETIAEQFQSRVRNLSSYNNDWFSFTHVLDFPKLYHKAPADQNHSPSASMRGHSYTRKAILPLGPVTNLGGNTDNPVSFSIPSNPRLSESGRNNVSPA